jgi:hypothetical protein
MHSRPCTAKFLISHVNLKKQDILTSPVDTIDKLEFTKLIVRLYELPTVVAEYLLVLRCQLDHGDDVAIADGKSFIPFHSVFRMQKELRTMMNYPSVEEASEPQQSNAHSVQPPLPPVSRLATSEGDSDVPLTIGDYTASPHDTSANSGRGQEFGASDALTKAAADATMWPTDASVHPTMYSLLSPPAANPDGDNHLACHQWNERAGWITGAFHIIFRIAQNVSV